MGTTRTPESHRLYRTEYEAIKNPELQAALHRLAHDDRIPAGLLRAWALALMRWRVGDRPRSPLPPSASIPGVSGQAALDLIRHVDTVVLELVPWRSGPLAALTIDTGEVLERIPPTPDPRTADWSPTA